MTVQTRWGVIGTGGIAHRTMPDLRECSNVEVLAVGSRSQQAAEAFAATWDVPRAYGNHADLLADTDVDVVYICTPPGSHHGLICQSLEAGKHVLCEKPLTLDAREARDVRQRAHSQGRFLMEAMWMKFSPSYRGVCAAIADGAIGDVRFVHAGFGFAIPDWMGTRLFDPAEGGGALLDLGIYPVTLAHAFLGVPTRIEATGDVRADGVDLTESIVLHSATDGLAQLAASITHSIAPIATIGGTDGFITMGPPFWTTEEFTIFKGLGPMSPPPQRITSPLEGAGYVPMFREVSDAVLNDVLDHPVNPLASTIEVLQTLDSIRSLLST